MPGVTSATVTARSSRLRWSLLLGCVVLIVYGSLFPFTGWRVPAEFPWPFNLALYRDTPATDILTNLLLYVPLGVLLALGRRWSAVPLVLLAGGSLSLGLETAQAFLPGRVTSLLDTALNVLGTGLGAVAILAVQQVGATYRLDALTRLRIDRVAWLGIAALAAWYSAQLIPFVPSLDIGNLKDGLKPLWHALQGTEPVSLWRIGVYVAAVAAVTVAGASALRVSRSGWVVAAALLAVLPLKALVIGRQVSPEAFAGTLGGVALGVALWASGRGRAQIVASVLVPVYIVAEALQPGAPMATTHPFSWIPFRAHLVQPVNGMANLADAIWPLLALACLCLRVGVRGLWALLPVIVLLLLGAEWAQRWVPGRYPDITGALVGAAAWIGAAAYAGRHAPTPSRLYPRPPDG